MVMYSDGNVWGFNPHRIHSPVFPLELATALRFLAAEGCEAADFTASYSLRHCAKEDSSTKVT